MRFSEHIIRRAVHVAEHILQTDDTYRQAAKKFSVSKTTVQKDLTHRLPHIDKGLAAKVGEIARIHQQTMHIRGGEAVRRKWAEAKGASTNGLSRQRGV